MKKLRKSEPRKTLLKTIDAAQRERSWRFSDCQQRFQGRPKNTPELIGPREFVPFEEDEEMTIGNIKSACERYFIPKIGKNLDCDVLAGEQGPSCKTVSQIPDLKVVYVRFIPSDSDGGDGDTNCNISVMKKTKTQSSTSANFCPPEPKTRSSPSKLMQPKEQLPACTSTCYPRSLSGNFRHAQARKNQQRNRNYDCEDF